MYDALHGFRKGRGTGTETMELKMSQQPLGLVYEPLFQVFLDVQKAYDKLYRGRCMDILRGYGIGPNLHMLLHWY